MIGRIGGVLAGTVLVLALVGAGPSSAAGGGQVTVSMTTEAWYNEPPPCVSLIDCSAAPSPNPYPADTVHVSIFAGRETARSYLQFSLGGLPSGATLTGGTLTLPLDTSSSDGSLSPEQANIVACLVTQKFTAVRGSLAAPPAANCKVSSAAVYVPKQQSFVVPLTPLAAGWNGTSASVALVPSAKDQQAGATWHATFHATTKPSTTAPPITATLTYRAPPSKHTSPSHTTSTSSAASGTASSGSSVAGGSQPTFTGGGTIPSFGTGSLSGQFGKPRTSTSTTTSTTTTVLRTATSVPASSVQPFTGGFAGAGFAYPLAWALPLLFLAGFGAIGRALTKELYRREA